MALIVLPVGSVVVPSGLITSRATPAVTSRIDLLLAPPIQLFPKFGLSQLVSSWPWVWTGRPRSQPAAASVAMSVSVCRMRSRISMSLVFISENGQIHVQGRRGRDPVWGLNREADLLGAVAENLEAVGEFFED